MQSVLIVVHLLVVIALVTVVLLQRSEGGALGTGGGGGFMTGRAQANALSRATAILATLFFVSALAMSILAGWNRAPKSLLDANAPANSASTTGQTKKDSAPSSVLDQLKALEGSAPKAPAESPAPPK
jgi:preprotein translocase subunit SecG